ncbi:MAG: hypothetical protein AAB353_07145 [Candidatus Hydrogenedentota bacterium]
MRSWNGALILALSFSVLFHLSMVTIFRIVVLFPEEPIDYVAFTIVPQETGTRDRLLLSSPDSAFERVAGETSEDPAREFARLADGLPSVELPTVEFAGMDLLRARSESLELRARSEGLFDSGPSDSWARFSKGLSSIGGALSRMAFGGEEIADEQVQSLGSPAPGFESEIEWMTAPSPRRLLTIPKIDALWGIEAGELPGPLVLVVRINREGEVVGVLPQVEAAPRLIEGIAEAVLTFRFESLGASAPETQHGTLTIRAEAGR